MFRVEINRLLLSLTILFVFRDIVLDVSLMKGYRYTRYECMVSYSYEQQKRACS